MSSGEFIGIDLDLLSLSLFQNARCISIDGSMIVLFCIPKGILETYFEQTLSNLYGNAR